MDFFSQCEQYYREFSILLLDNSPYTGSTHVASPKMLCQIEIVIILNFSFFFLSDMDGVLN
jgi:hypothetical protein